MLSPATYFGPDAGEHRELLAHVEYVWDMLHRLRGYIKTTLKPGLLGTVEHGAFVSDQVFLAPGAHVERGAYVKGPAIIGRNTVIRHGAYVREWCVIGDNCVVGHASEIKHSIMLDGAQAAHFNYVGDSVLGRRVNLGAGVRTANFKNDGSRVMVRNGEAVHATGLNKMGAIIGDDVRIGCNAVTMPGTLLGPGCSVYPAAVLRGVYPAGTLVKHRQTLEEVRFE